MIKTNKNKKVEQQLKNTTSGKDKKSLVLAIDTSCDETSVAVVSGRRILANVISSQVELHKKYGGVMPGLAKLEHAKRIDSVVLEALKRAKIAVTDLSAVAVTVGPGLAIALEVGVMKAKELAIANKIPLIPVNHMEAHFFSAYAQNSLGKGSKLADGALEETNMGLLISGGHTEIVLSHGVGDHQKIGQTLDDACGECFDKAARMLGLGYPGGAVLSELADQARKTSWKAQVVQTSKGERVRLSKNKQSAELTKLQAVDLSLPVPLGQSNDLKFSYSGLKTAFWQLLNKLESVMINTEEDFDQNQQPLQEVNWHFSADLIKGLSLLLEVTAIRHLEKKLELALKNYPTERVLIGGGVVNNTYGRKQLRQVCQKFGKKLYFAYSEKLFGDNAAMIGLVGSMYLTANKNLVTSPELINQVERQPSLSLA